MISEVAILPVLLFRCIQDDIQWEHFQFVFLISVRKIHIDLPTKIRSDLFAGGNRNNNFLIISSRIKCLLDIEIIVAVDRFPLFRFGMDWVFAIESIVQRCQPLLPVKN